MRYLSFIYPTLAILLWAGNVVVSRLSAHVIGPQAITFYRLALAVILLSPFVAAPAWRNRAIFWRHFGKLAVLGFLAMCLFQSLSYLAAETTSATNMAVFTALVPLLTVALSIPILGEAPTTGLVFGGMLSLGGILYLVSGGEPGQIFRNGIHAGDLMMLIAATIYALYGILLKRWNVGLPGWQSTYGQALCALAIMFPAFLATPPELRQLDARTLPLIGYAGAFASVLLPFLWIRGVEKLGPSRCSIFMNLLPVFTAAIAFLLLGEPIRLYHLLGGVTILAGVACAQVFSRPLAREAAGSRGEAR
ncbi:drug/metabolite transporter (DMT)-like permease [Sphingobium sp. B1D7B]|uniref:DMT family transporter n=1 Tax=Sphingobium sp. B1D7B TaxID=2940578 RepID=UPI0022249ACF|nr:DMT family transporter [Sphingobium sp. B1D7B]MCW2406081.1 drug/metabolite transporter (DMT)-like permease [Sphingobium sp. B1D7B]